MLVRAHSAEVHVRDSRPHICEEAAKTKTCIDVHRTLHNSCVPVFRKMGLQLGLSAIQYDTEQCDSSCVVQSSSKPVCAASKPNAGESHDLPLVQRRNDRA